MALPNSEDEMPYNASFYHGLHCLLRQNRSSENEIQNFWEIMTCDPFIYTMDHSDFLVCRFMQNYIDPKRV